ncbi:MAG: polysaccharide biosynthesis protein [Ignavibacteriales bacterium]|nr:MAG: polysaccharide biosynthesis protein [Ignavibacteriales bacterium]
MEQYSDILKKLTGHNYSETFLTNEELTFFSNKKVLITGAAGSIGSGLVKEVSKLNISGLGLLDINESGLVMLKYVIENITTFPVNIFLTDISIESELKKVFESFKPDIIFHAAAYKHIPVLEVFPEQASRVNILGTYNMVKLAGEYKAEKFVFISTDKAVNPVSVMGKSKKKAEILINLIGVSYSTEYIIVRLGNIIGSRGSASEIFTYQIKNDLPVTLTGRYMKRYFMTINQAVCLCIKAASAGKDGQLFIMDMKDQVLISELIKELVAVNSTSDPNLYNVIVADSRNGEKVEEDFMTNEEKSSAIFKDGLYVIDLYSIKNGEEIFDINFYSLNKELNRT